MVITIPPFFVTVVAGLLIAFALQLLLTSFGVAVGVTLWGQAFNQSAADANGDDPDGDAVTTSATMPQIGLGVGIGTLLMINTVLFVACFLAVRLSLVADVVMGATLGVAIWSAYLLVLVWLGTTAAGSVLGVTTEAFKVGWQGFRKMVNIVFSRSSAMSVEPSSLPEALTDDNRSSAIMDVLSDLDWEQLLSFLQTLNQHLKRVVGTTGRSPVNPLHQTVATYLLQTSPQQLTRKAIQKDFTAIIAPDPVDAAQMQQLAQLNRDLFYQVLNQRDDLPRKKIAKIVDRLEAVRLQVLDQVKPVVNLADAASERVVHGRLEPSSQPVLEPTHTNSVSADLVSAIVTGMTPLLTQLDGQMSLQQLTQQTGQLVHKLETAVIDQASQVQWQTQQQIANLKYQTQQGVDTARSATAIAAWWLFSTAFTAMLTAAIAGALAVASS